MASLHSLLACLQAAMAIERSTSLTTTTGAEPLTVDFKEKGPDRQLKAPACSSRGSESSHIS